MPINVINAGKKGFPLLCNQDQMISHLIIHAVTARKRYDTHKKDTHPSLARRCIIFVFFFSDEVFKKLYGIYHHFHSTACIKLIVIEEFKTDLKTRYSNLGHFKRYLQWKGRGIKILLISRINKRDLKNQKKPEYHYIQPFFFNIYRFSECVIMPGPVQKDRG
jgi:hypothetical protein